MPRRHEILTLLCLLALAGGVIVAPSTLQDRLRGGLRDLAAPSLRGLRSARERLDGWWTERIVRAAPDAIDAAALEDELETARRKIRALEIAVATLREERALSETIGAAPWRGTTGDPLLIHELLSASVLGVEHSEQVRQGKLLDLGSSGGAVESSLVLDDPRPLVDQGAPSGLSPGNPVFAGRCVVGRVARVGRCVSTIVPVSDPEFRGLARIVRGEGEAAVFGSEGLLEGAADGLCRLRHIPATEAVSAGDQVCTAGGDATGPATMFYGTVESAELPPGAPHWDVRVRPSVKWDRLKTVQVLRSRPRGPLAD